jgi:biotin operon repressor
MKVAALIAATGKSESAIASAIQHLLNEGEIIRVRHGTYCLRRRRVRRQA